MHSEGCNTWFVIPSVRYHIFCRLERQDGQKVIPIFSPVMFVLCYREELIFEGGGGGGRGGKLLPLKGYTESFFHLGQIWSIEVIVDDLHLSLNYCVMRGLQVPPRAP